MNEIKKVREYTPTFINPEQIRKKSKIKVAAYARVSTDKDEQEESFERQVDYYTRYIKHNEEWDFAGIYADPGITGTRADKRPEFQRLMSDCRKGLINKILCKSIARFARNTVDAIKYIRELKELGIGVVFETQNIDTSNQGGDILLIVLSGMAEEESRTISKNVTWAFQKKFAKGEFMLNYNRFMGYTKNQNNELVIEPNEAKIIKRIYREYLHGYGYAAIAKRLSDDNIKTVTGNQKWHPTVIESILKNEKYTGSTVMGKTYKIDVLSKKRVKSDGIERKMYYAEDCIPQIIDKETFNAVQIEIQKRKELNGCSKTNEGKYTSKYVFSKKIICGDCGNYYRRHAQTYNKVYQATWVCPNHKINPDECKQLFITESYIKDSFIKLLNELGGDIEKIKVGLLDKISKLLDKTTPSDSSLLDEEIQIKQSEMMAIFKKKNNGEISIEEYQKKATEIATEINELREKKDNVDQRQCLATMNKNRLKEIEECLSNINPDKEFNDEVFASLIDHIVVKNRYDLEFNFKIGIVKTVNYHQE